MHPRRYDYTLAPSHLFIITAKGSYNEKVASVASDRLAQFSALHPLSFLRVLLKAIQVALEVAIGVGIRMGEVNCVVIMLELDTEGQRIIMTGSLALHRVLIVADVTTCSHPALPVCLALDR